MSPGNRKRSLYRTSSAMSIAILRHVKRGTKLLISMVGQPWMTTERLVDGLREMGVRPGGILLVHSSLKSAGFVPGGARTVISALRECVGGDGTLAMPAHSWEWVSKGLRKIDVRTTPSCVGTITEVFRGLPAVARSLHPTHSAAAIGPRAAWILEGHEDASTPCGEGTPYAKVIDGGGQILFLGCGLDRNTAFHSLEAMANVPYLLREDADAFELIDGQGRVVHRTIRRHRERIPRRFREMEETLENAGALARGKVGNAPCLLVEARAMRDGLLPQLERDPQFLLALNHS